MNHTPTPWKVQKCVKEFGGYQIGNDEFGEVASISKYKGDKANAQFIVTACNSHEELKEVLSKIVLSVRAMNFNPETILYKEAEQALSKAGA